jgi:hypothetical protein
MVDFFVPGETAPSRAWSPNRHEEKATELTRRLSRYRLSHLACAVIRCRLRFLTDRRPTRIGTLRLSTIALARRIRPADLSTSTTAAVRSHPNPIRAGLLIEARLAHSCPMGTKSRESIYGSSIRHSAERAAEARKNADRLARRPKTTPVHELERYMRCKDCSQVRGYPYKRSHLVALRPT